MTSITRLSFAMVFVFVLMAIPLSLPASYFMPLWSLLLVLYIQFSLPKHHHLALVFMIGLMTDALSSGLLGLHCTAMVVTVWLASNSANRFRLFPMFKQMTGMLGFFMLYQFVYFALRWQFGFGISPESFLFGTLTSTLCWPWFQYLLDKMLFASVR